MDRTFIICFPRQSVRVPKSHFIFRCNMVWIHFQSLKNQFFLTSSSYHMLYFLWVKDWKVTGQPNVTPKRYSNYYSHHFYAVVAPNPRRGGRGALNKVSYREAPPRGATPYPFTTIFVQPLSVMIFLHMFTFQTLRFCLVMCHISPINLGGYVVKLTRFLVPFEHVLFTCSESFQVLLHESLLVFAEKKMWKNLIKTS